MAQGYPESHKGDGYTWEELSKSENGRLLQAMAVRGFCQGFEDGYYTRCIKVHIAQSGATRLSAKEWADCYSGTGDFFPENPEYYVREIDSFLKTYPLCRREGIWSLFLQLSQVWVAPQIGMAPGPSYRDIGEKCLQPDK